MDLFHTGHPDPLPSPELGLFSPYCFLLSIEPNTVHQPPSSCICSFFHSGFSSIRASLLTLDHYPTPQDIQNLPEQQPQLCSPPPSASCLRQGHSLVPQLPLAGMSSSSMASLFPPAVPPGLYSQVTISKSSSLILNFITLHTALVLLSPSVSLSLFHSSPLYPSASDI